MRRVGLFVLLVGATACAARTPAAVATGPVQAPAVVSPLTALLVDPVEHALAAAEAAFAAGQAASQHGHLKDARLEFDRALDTLLLMPGGARSDPRLAAAVDSLTDRISAIELEALSSGDGFTETSSEPASIDTLLSLPEAEADALPADAVASNVRADLAATVHDIPIPLNDRVLRFVELFQGRLRGFLTEGLTRGAAYLPMIQMVFREEGLPLDLAFVPLVESAFKPTAVSRANARGVWQFMRGTGTENGLQHDWYIDERADPEKATRAAAKYLKTLHKMFGDWHLALASYNGGPGRVQRAMKRSGIDDFWTLSASAGHLPRETRDYVPMILAATIIARNPAQYDFAIPPALPFATDLFTVSRPVDLRRVAEWAGVSADAVRALNPELRRWTTPVRAREYQLRVPIGTMRSVIQGYSETAPEDSAALQVLRRAQGRIRGQHRPPPGSVARRPGRRQLPRQDRPGETRPAPDRAAGASGRAAGWPRDDRWHRQSRRDPHGLPRAQGRYALGDCPPLRRQRREPARLEPPQGLGPVDRRPPADSQRARRQRAVAAQRILHFPPLSRYARGAASRGPGCHSRDIPAPA